ncbi:hypothetical protein [Paenibacillus sp. DMB20]|uniref:hypothetical protein n=1 Tax=Paenibacillus sp. DMB20 TaxID=1642570 RepID=UPI000A6D4C11|nr:hypothetical protein [Paenibacillus sp. DMB20]
MNPSYTKMPRTKPKSGSSWRKALPYLLAVGSLLAIWQAAAFFSSVVSAAGCA